LTYGNTLSGTNTYDDRARLKTAKAGTSVIDLLYGYDGADNVTSFVNNSVAGSSRTMTYDALDRLSTSTAASLWGSATYSYDELGNRKHNSYNGFAADYTYDGPTNRLTFAAAGSYRDANRTFTWSRPGRLESSSDGATYAYDGHGRRVRKTDAS